MTQEERKNKQIAAATTVGVNAILLLVLIFAGGWGFSGEGLGQGDNDYGIEVNLGYDEQGSGIEEPMTEVGKEENTDDENPPQETQQSVTEPQPQTPAPADPEPAPETKTTTENAALTDPTSDVEIKEKKKEEKIVEKTPEKKIEKTEAPVEKKKPEEKPPQPVEKPKAVYQGKTSNAASNENGEGKKGTPGNEGDDAGKEGNKGVEGGREGVAVYKGKPSGGGGGGFGLSMAGWAWDETPKAPKIPDSNIRGKIVFEIEVDENGDITGITTVENQLSPTAERLFREEILKHSLTKTSSGQTPPRTKGRVTYNLDLQ